MIHRAVLVGCALVSTTSSLCLGQEPPKKEEVLGAVERATRFMMERVANRGGFLFHYSQDFSKQWGELPARKSQIWVQPPGTPAVGQVLLDAYLKTGDEQYLNYAETVARALIWGQLPAGGWNYLIDFKPTGLKKWYEEVGANARGWEEFYHSYGNATFDDDTTASATRFLLRFYHATLDPSYEPALLKALSFILEAQYPNGAWPQRYPLNAEYPHGEHPDYTPYYTYNDGVMSNNIYLLLEAYEKLGEEKYREAARRGMDFYLISQLPSPQGGWAQQYTLDLQPGWARSYEPAAVCSGQTVKNIRDLETFFLVTGDRRYLGPISKALNWLRRSVLESTSPGTHATFYQVGTNRPLFARHFAEGGKLTGYHVGYEPFDLPSYGGYAKLDLDALDREFRQIQAVTTDSARVRMLEEREDERELRRRPPAEEVLNILATQEKSGAWITEIQFLDTDNYADNPPETFEGIDTGTYVRNMYILMSHSEDSETSQE